MDTGLSPKQLESLRNVFRRVSGLRKVILFGSRAKGTFSPESDVDLALVGISDDLIAEAVAESLDSLPMPVRFDVKAFDSLRSAPLRGHIERVGTTIYEADSDDRNDGATQKTSVPAELLGLE